MAESTNAFYINSKHLCTADKDNSAINKCTKDIFTRTYKGTVASLLNLYNSISLGCIIWHQWKDKSLCKKYISLNYQADEESYFNLKKWNKNKDFFFKNEKKNVKGLSK